MKFEEAYHSQKDVNLPLYEITNIFVNEPNIFETQYRHFLFCPECQQAKLSYRNADTPYLSAYPKAQHDLDCTLAQDTVNQAQALRIINDYNNNLEVRQEIHRQMDSIMRILLAENNALPVRENMVQQHNNVNQRHENPNAQQNNHNRLPRKRIDLMLKDTDYDVYKIFYGNVILRWKEAHSPYHYNKILLYTINTHEFKCQIKVTDKVYAYLSRELKDTNNTQCKIVFIGKLKKGKKIASNNCGFAILLNSQLIKIIK